MERLPFKERERGEVGGMDLGVESADVQRMNPEVHYELQRLLPKALSEVALLGDHDFDLRRASLVSTVEVEVHISRPRRLETYIAAFGRNDKGTL